MKTSAEYLEEAAKYDTMADQTVRDRRRREYRMAAEVYRYMAVQAMASSRVLTDKARGREPQKEKALARTGLK
jgi:hypothetical protein